MEDLSLSIVQDFAYMRQREEEMREVRVVVALLACLFGSVSCCSRYGGVERMDVYIGTYTRGDSEGIYLLGLDMQTGELTNRGLAAKCEQPSFLAIHPDRSFLYAVGEYGKFGTENAGAIVAFSIDAESGKLVELKATID